MVLVVSILTDSSVVVVNGSVVAVVVDEVVGGVSVATDIIEEVVGGVSVCGCVCDIHA